jgi:hypothetical protein
MAGVLTRHRPRQRRDLQARCTWGKRLTNRMSAGRRWTGHPAARFDAWGTHRSGMSDETSSVVISVSVSPTACLLDGEGRVIQRQDSMPGAAIGVVIRH